jgi:hypothetical protein
VIVLPGQLFFNTHLAQWFSPRKSPAPRSAIDARKLAPASAAQIELLDSDIERIAQTVAVWRANRWMGSPSPRHRAAAASAGGNRWQHGYANAGRGMVPKTWKTTTKPLADKMKTHRPASGESRWAGRAQTEADPAEAGRMNKYEF